MLYKSAVRTPSANNQLYWQDTFLVTKAGSRWRLVVLLAVRAPVCELLLGLSTSMPRPLTPLPVEHTAHCSKPAWRHACTLVLVSTVTKCVFIPPPPPPTITHSAWTSATQPMWLWSCHAFGYHCRVPEVSFPSAPPILSFGIVLSREGGLVISCPC